MISDGELLLIVFHHFIFTSASLTLMFKKRRNWLLSSFLSEKKNENFQLHRQSSSNSPLIVSARQITDFTVQIHPWRADPDLTHISPTDR